MRSNALLRALTVLGLGAAGLIGGHALGYAIAVPDDVHRTALLAATGHGYWPSASKLAIVLGVAATVAGVVSGYAHRSPALRTSWRSVGWRISLLQCAGFVALEVIERAMASASPTAISVGVLVIGLTTQVVTALVVALLIVGLRRLGAALVPAAARVGIAGSWRIVPDAERAPSSRSSLCERVRGPPALRSI